MAEISKQLVPPTRIRPGNSQVRSAPRRAAPGVDKLTPLLSLPRPLHVRLAPLTFSPLPPCVAAYSPIYTPQRSIPLARRRSHRIPPFARNGRTHCLHPRPRHGAPIGCSACPAAGLCECHFDWSSGNCGYRCFLRTLAPGRVAQMASLNSN